jgi:hypothetical protein
MEMAEDMVNHPKHYTQYKHEVIELTSCFDFVTGNAVKYLLRAADKNGVEDLEKAVWYLNYGAEHPESATLLKPCGLVDLAETYGNPIVTDLVRGIDLASAGVSVSIGAVTTAFKRASDQVATFIKFTKIIRSKEEQKEVQDDRDDDSEFLHCGDNAKSLWKWRVTSVTYR